MNTLTSLTPSAIMASGLKRISALTDQYGITSPEVLDACTRWGSILDDVNHPDSTCRNCGEAVTFVSDMQVYYHSTTKSKYCLTHAAAEAAPLTVADWGKVKARALEVERRQAQARITPSGVDPNPTTKARSIRPLLKGK